MPLTNAQKQKRARTKRNAKMQKLEAFAEWAAQLAEDHHLGSYEIVGIMARDALSDALTERK
jgi:hypothetical protein